MDEKKEYRITFHDGPMGNKSLDYDVLAYSMDEAFQMGIEYGEKHRLRSLGYINMTLSEKPKGPSVIGIEFVSKDTALKKEFAGYVFIKANSEEQAREYYEKNLHGKRYWFNTGKPEPEGKCVFGKIKSSYFAAAGGYGYDATKVPTLEDKIEGARDIHKNSEISEQERTGEKAKDLKERQF